MKHAAHTKRAVRVTAPPFIIALATLAVVVALGVGGTYAYLTYTGNQVVNNASIGEVGVAVLEDGTEVTGALQQNVGTVTLKNTTGDHGVSEVVRVSIVPEVEQSFYDAETKTTQYANVFMDEGNEDDETSVWAQGPTSDASGNQVMTLGLVTLTFNSDWATNWTYKDGAFYYKKTLAPSSTTEPLLTGVAWADADIATNDYTMRVNVFAEALEAEPANAPAEWGCTVADDGTVTVSKS